jgi:hypothetical protein
MAERILGGLLGVALGSAFTCLGLALLMNYRGFTTWHVRATFDVMEALRLSQRPLLGRDERRVEQQVRFERVTGAGFLTAGICMTVIILLLATGVMGHAGSGGRTVPHSSPSKAP